ncbi:hypothetical protein [Roseovarius mucosus]|uniref:hypothetical protein n=2 Tax=Roseovarius mucosus TaxID=215743 RepID=UPI003F71E8D6
MSVVMNVELPTKAFFRFCPEVLLLCLGSMRFLVRHFAESALQKQLMILFFRGFSALKLDSKWLLSSTDSARARYEHQCESKAVAMRNMNILGVESAFGHKGVWKSSI